MSKNLALTVFTDSAELTYDLSQAFAEKSANSVSVSEDSVTFEYPPDKYGYLVIEGNTAAFAERPSVTAFSFVGGEQVHIELSSSFTGLARNAVLFLLAYGEDGIIFRHPIVVGQGSTHSVTMPAQEGTATFAIRLAGQNKVNKSLNLALNVTAPRANEVDVSRGDGRSSPSPSKLSPALRQHVPPVLLNWTQIEMQAKIFSGLGKVAGVGGDGGPTFERLRVDQPFETKSATPWLGYLLDLTSSDSQFGWEELLTPQNVAATSVLVRHLREAQRAGLPTLIHVDPTVSIRPFFLDVRPLFSHVIEKGSAQSADVPAFFRDVLEYRTLRLVG